MAYKRMRRAGQRVLAEPGRQVHLESLFIALIFVAAWINALSFMG